MNLEAVVHVLSGQLQDEARKRKRCALEASIASDTSMSDKTESPSPQPLQITQITQPLHTPHTPETCHEHEWMLTSKVVRDLIYSVVIQQPSTAGTQHQSKARTFVARAICAVFHTVQSIQPQPFGPHWAALLYICELLVHNAFDDGPYDLNTPSVNISHKGCEVARVATNIGRQGSQEGNSLAALVKAARQWSRVDPTRLDKIFDDVWRVLADNPKVRVAVEAVVWPCARGYLLFNY